MLLDCAIEPQKRGSDQAWKSDCFHDAFSMNARLLIGCTILLASLPLVFASDPIIRETVIRQARPRLAGEQFDHQERDPRLRGMFAAADAEAERAVANVPRNRQFILRFWAAKKKILENKYGISWKTPAEINPTIVYDSYGQPRVTESEIREITPVVQKQIRDSNEKITAFERTFEGIVYVWTRVSEFESGRYLVQRKGPRWQFVRRDRVQE